MKRRTPWFRCFFILCFFFFPSQSRVDSLKIPSKFLKAYLLKNNLVPFIFVLCPPPPPSFLATADDCIDRCCLRLGVRSDKWLCLSLEEGRKSKADNLVVHHPLSKCREEIGYWPEVAFSGRRYLRTLSRYDGIIPKLRSFSHCSFKWEFSSLSHFFFSWRRSRNDMLDIISARCRSFYLVLWGSMWVWVCAFLLMISAALFWEVFLLFICSLLNYYSCHNIYSPLKSSSMNWLLVMLTFTPCMSDSHLAVFTVLRGSCLTAPSGHLSQLYTRSGLWVTNLSYS